MHDKRLIFASDRSRWLRGPFALLLLAGAIVAWWPAFIERGIDAGATLEATTPAPIPHDYEQRDALVAYWERAVREGHRNDMLSPRQLAGQYLARYRETGDIDDVVRARDMVERSLAIMPHNIAALSERASVELTLHQFSDALRDADALLVYAPRDAGFLAQRASLLMELGRYADANEALNRVPAAYRGDAPVETVRARYDELTGNLARARALLADAMTQVDALIDESAQTRAWYHMRAGEMAFNAGDISGAVGDEHVALTIFPTDNLALKDLAKFELAQHHLRAALAAATEGAHVTPFAETLGYEADAQAGLGDARGSAITRETIFAIERIGNAYHVNDRLLAVYYADHHLRAADALTIARREVAVRGNEIYAQDTLAWAAAQAHQWGEARRAALAATRFETEDPVLQYHAAIIALHVGARAEGIQRLRTALGRNARFHPTEADQARRLLGQLGSPT